MPFLRALGQKHRNDQGWTEIKRLTNWLVDRQQREVVRAEGSAHRRVECHVRHEARPRLRRLEERLREQRAGRVGCEAQLGRKLAVRWLHLKSYFEIII